MLFLPALTGDGARDYLSIMQVVADMIIMFIGARSLFFQDLVNVFHKQSG